MDVIAYIGSFTTLSASSGRSIVESTDYLVVLGALVEA